MLLNEVNRRNYELMCQRTDLPRKYMDSLENAKLFMDYAENFFLTQGYDFFESCDRALMILSEGLQQLGQELDVNAMIPPVYKFWFYNREFEGWLKDTDDDGLLLINI